MNNKITLCLIVFNELQGCKIDVKNLPRNFFLETIAIDGGSTDGTVEYLKKNNIKVYKQRTPGLNAAYMEANKVAKGDFIITFFPKGNLPVNHLLRFNKYFKKDYDLVIASRQLAGSINEEDYNFFKFRKWSVFILAYIVSLIWQKNKKNNFIKDILHGFKGWKKTAFNKMKIVEARGVSIDLQMVVRSYKLKLKYTEFATKEKPRSYGETHFKFFPTGLKLIRYLIFEIQRKD